MYRGIEFELVHSYPNILKFLFYDFDATKYIWDIFNEQAWDKKYNELFESRVYSSSEFKNALQKPAFSIMLLQIYAFNGKVNIIESYEDYLLSECQIMFFIIDCDFIDIYCKNEKDLKFFYHKAEKLNTKKLIYLTEKNDLRTEFNFKG